MAKRKLKAMATAPHVPETHINDEPVNVIHDRLNQAHATLDLIHTMTTNGGCSEEHLETLCSGTLSAAIHGAMLRIEEALEATDKLGAEVRHGQA